MNIYFLDKKYSSNEIYIYFSFSVNKAFSVNKKKTKKPKKKKKKELYKKNSCSCKNVHFQSESHVNEEKKFQNRLEGLL